MVRVTQEDLFMTSNERELLNIIRQQSNQGQAVEIAIKTIFEFLKQHGSYQELTVAYHQEQA